MLVWFLKIANCKVKQKRSYAKRKWILNSSRSWFLELKKVKTDFFWIFSKKDGRFELQSNRLKAVLNDSANARCRLRKICSSHEALDHPKAAHTGFKFCSFQIWSKTIIEGWKKNLQKGSQLVHNLIWYIPWQVQLKLSKPLCDLLHMHFPDSTICCSPCSTRPPRRQTKQNTNLFYSKPMENETSSGLALDSSWVRCNWSISAWST